MAEWEVIRVLDGHEGEYPIAIREHPEMGHLMGYAGVPAWHPFYNVKFFDCAVACGEERCDHRPQATIDVHGGLSYSEAGDDDYLPAGYWWFGFDCAHYRDIVPMIEKLRREFGREPTATHLGETYKGREFVEAETRKMARQLAAVAVAKKIGGEGNESAGVQ